MTDTGSHLPIVSIKEAVEEQIDQISDLESGALVYPKTSLEKFNRAGMNGIMWGSIYNIAGRSGCGKSTLLNQIETDLLDSVINPDCYQEVAILNFNFEMSASRLVGRKISRHFKKSIKQLYQAADNGNITRQEIEEIESWAENALSNLPIHYVDTSGNWKQMRDTIYEIWERYPTKKFLITLDHAALTKRIGTAGATDSLYDTVAMFNDMKKKKDSSYIILSQLNRNIENPDRLSKSYGHYPLKGDIFGGDATYQSSDLVGIMHKPADLHLASYGPNELATEGKIYMHYLKTRDGEPFIASFDDNLAHGELTELPQL